MLFDFGNGLLIDQGTLIGHALEAIAHAQFADRRAELPGEIVVYALLYQQAIGAHAGLTGIAVFAGDGSVHRRIQIGVVEHDERGIAAQFQR